MKGQTPRSMEKNRYSRNRCTHIYSQLVCNKDVKQLSGEREKFLPNGARTIGQPHANNKKISTNPYITSYIKYKSIWTIELNVKSETIKCLEENSAKSP